MLLKSIELSGFKSFAKKSTLEFSSPISAIVGPNGSGKSNVAEAFRFVLGEQSIKSLRGKKGEDLIFNGAGDSARANRASAKLVFDNTKKFLNIDFPEVAIERVVHRDGVNEYLINGSAVRLKDVIELLASAHIGSSGHHIISQGEADRILNSNMRERRAMLEDALGLKIYQYKRAESERKLEKTVENIASVESLRREIAPHLRFLKKQVEKMEKAVELKNTLVTLAKHYLKREDIYVKANRKNIEGKIAPLEKKKKELEGELAQARKVLEDSKDKDAKREEVIELERKIQGARSERDSLIQELGRIQGQIDSEERILKKQKEIVASAAGKTVLLVDVESFASNIKEKVSAILAQGEVSIIKKIAEEIRQIFSDFIKSHREKADDKVIKESEEALAELGAKRKEIDGKLALAKGREESLQKEYQKIQSAIEKEKDTSRDAEKSLFRIMSEENTVVIELAQEKEKLNTLALVEADFNREREECAMLGGREVLDYASLVLEEGLEERSIQDERRRELQKIKIRLEDSGLGGSDETMKEYQETSERDTFLARELEDLTKSAESLRELIAELGEKLDIEFKEGINKINEEFQKYFALMFGGGTAGLRVVREKVKIKSDTDLEMDEEMLEGSAETLEESLADKEGIEIEVNLPRKKIKGLMMLSGGERALTSIALLFAMSQVNPPPFIILDETDAALDEANSRKYGDMIENLAKQSQLILITHNRETMSRAGIIYGVTMGGGGVSKVLSIQFEEAVSVAK
ncbi:MAG: hypothetical protein A2741_02425 [Candidatus Zambryskibacteria bacterium RIFCSPHIGHO2_01_FULL_43_27]|nr:MAG: hypothetical protein A2741_02425 [Candidatus Zambryskibacteria bacterium RIFCSPHIGHO2_01_FULL_43_27]